MGIPHRRAIAACVSLLCGALLLATSSLSAQNRFEALKQDTIPGVGGLRIITVRDTVLDACYTLFMTEPPSTADVPQPQIDEARQQSIQRLRDAAAWHDEQVGALRTQFESRTGLTPEMARIPGLAVARNVSLGDSLVRYEVERMRVDGIYQSALRAEIPGSLPPASATPGMKTGAWEDLAEATRRAVTNPDPTPLQTLSDPGSLNSQVASLVQQLSDAPRLSATGPVPCSPPKSEASKSPASETSKSPAAKPAAPKSAAAPKKR
jgi:hypothetical protein